MERGGGSSERSRELTTSRNSSGCLIVKKKSDRVGRINYSPGKRRNSQYNKEKKRSRMAASDSESSDEILTPPRRKVDRETPRVRLNANGRVKDSSEDNEFGSKRDRLELDDDDGSARSDSGKSDVRKRSKLDVFEFDEYDGFDRTMVMENRCDNSSTGFSRRSHVSPSMPDSGRVAVSGGGRVLERRKQSYLSSTHSLSSQDKYASDSDSDEPIRVQGRNGVLKVMVNRKKDGDDPVRSFGRGKYRGTKSRTKLQDHTNAGFHEKQSFSKKTTKRENIVLESTSRRSSDKDSDSVSEESDMSEKSERWKSKKKVNSKLQKRLGEGVKYTASKERKVRSGGGTEKQRLRERLKGMLIEAGWVIEYRPRKNKDYVDAVYINPSGTAYWSIVKAYDALLKQINDENNDSGSGKDFSEFASLTDDILNKLARKTNKNTLTKTKTRREKDNSCSESEKETDGDEGGTGDSDADEEESRKKRLPYVAKRSLHHSNGGPSSGLDRHNIHRRKSKKVGRCTLLVRGSMDEKKSERDGLSPYTGKRTMLSWLIDSGVVKQSQKVQYMNGRRTKVLLEGWVTRDGIHCGCCSKIVTVAKFEIHAKSKLRKPFQNIYLESGDSLLQCQINAWNLQKDGMNLGFHNVDTEGDDPNDDTCGICGDGGDLICCDGCPSTYHQACLGMKSLPAGDWHCPNCTCKFCGDNTMPLLSCNMCERKYHTSCTSEKDTHEVTFCGSKCSELFEKLQKYLGARNELEAGFSWSLIHRVDATDSDSNSQAVAQGIEINSKLAVGLAIMDECFLPIFDRRSGINLIRNVLYNCGSNFNRMNYTGFYTAILERGDEIISAASLRFHGTKLAEMPFIGTRHIYRRQGMCRRLFDAIESAMRSLKVEKLVIPAIPDFLHAWTGNFGFTPLEDSVKTEMRSLNTLVFPGIDMLQKPFVNDGVGNPDDRVEDLIICEPNEKSGADSSPCQDALDSENKQKSGSSCEDDGHMDVIAETDLELEDTVDSDEKLTIGSASTGKSVDVPTDHGSCDIETAQASKDCIENGHKANGCLVVTENSSSVDKSMDRDITSSVNDDDAH